MTRQCGDCQLCCKLLPVRGLGKGAGERCRHQKFGVGCKVYRSRSMPAECKLWTCRWLVDSDAGDLSRPDRSHYVVDVMPDYVIARNGPDAEAVQIGAIQVWVDPKHPDAHRDPALRAYLAERGKHGIVGIIRYDARRGFTLVPPALSSTDDWIEVQSGVENEHSVEEILRVEKVMQVVNTGLGLMAADDVRDTTPQRAEGATAPSSGGQP